MRISDWSSDVCSSDLSERRQVASAATTIAAAKTRRPPNRSAQTPSGTRAIEPDRIGTHTSSPNPVSDRHSWTFDSNPMIEQIVQAAKHAIAEMLLAHRTLKGSVPV